MADIIREWETINKIELLEQEIFQKSGIKPYNISHWNSTSEYRQELSEIFNVQQYDKESIFDYQFSYDISNGQKKKIMKKLGIEDRKIRGLVVPTGTLAIRCALSWIKEKCKITDIAILCPAYFAAFHICKSMDINYEEVFMKRDIEKGFSIPYKYLDELIQSGKVGAVYVTDPIYCTSEYLQESDVNYLRGLVERGIKIIWDGCLSVRQNSYVTALCTHKNVVSIFEPHKPLAINGSKFSIVCFNEIELDFFESRADVIYGGLSVCNLTAIKQFLSENYEMCRSFFKNKTRKNYEQVKKLVDKYENVQIDRYDESLYVTCYFSRIPSVYSVRYKFLKDVITQSQCSFIPGRRNHFSEEINFCFRINLSRCDQESLKMLEKMFVLLNKYNVT